jgi:hypothetical protein
MPQVNQPDNKFDARVQALKATIESGQLKTFQHIFQIAGKTAVRNQLGLNYTTFSRKVSDPRLFTVQELFNLANLFKIDPRLLFEQILSDLR